MVARSRLFTRARAGVRGTGPGHLQGVSTTPEGSQLQPRSSDGDAERKAWTTGGRYLSTTMSQGDNASTARWQWLHAWRGLAVVAAATLTPITALAASAVTGTASYRERIALPPDAVFEATLEDVSRADAPAEVI